MRNIEAIARDRANTPLNQWPDHTSSHSVTLMGVRLFDYECLRCWLERIESERLAAKEKKV